MTVLITMLGLRAPLATPDGYALQPDLPQSWEGTEPESEDFPVKRVVEFSW